MLSFIFLTVIVAMTFAQYDGLEDLKVFRFKRAITESKDQFLAENLECHNNFREKHHAPPLQYKQDLMVYAQNYAQNLASTDKFAHSGGPYGENLFAGTGTFDGNSACNSWYSEVKNYDFSQENPPNFSQVGHFTQLVWKSTTHMGIGYATSAKSNWTYVCASYSPPGNYKNKYKVNVLPA